MEILDSIRRIVAEDAAHKSVTHELYLRPESVAKVKAAAVDQPARHKPLLFGGIPVKTQNVGRDCIATLRDGKIISVTNL